jgi:hypothetical protein
LIRFLWVISNIFVGRREAKNLANCSQGSSLLPKAKAATCTDTKGRKDSRISSPSMTKSRSQRDVAVPIKLTPTTPGQPKPTLKKKSALEAFKTNVAKAKVKIIAIFKFK